MGHCFVTTDESTASTEVFQSIYQWGKMGILGLEYFFVLSSFLISIIILEEKDQTNDFNISNFLIRRTLRVWPLYFLILGIGFLLSIIAAFLNMDLSPLPEWPYLLFFLVNFYIISHGSEFLFFIAFLWSISVEEQFYIIWSFFMKFIHKYFSLFCFILVIVSLIFRFYYLQDSAMLYFHTVSALGNFGIGGLIAVGMFEKNKVIDRISNIPKLGVALIYLLMFLTVAFYHELMTYDLFRIFERIIYSLFFAFFILDQTIGKNRLFNCGKFSIFNYFGKISYGLYCYHGVVITIFLKIIYFSFPSQPLPIVLLVFPPVIFAFTILLSHLSYRYFERYFLNLKQKFYTFQP
jgi:peptidoglycan/LPS O-acetylase OafA/YrhL